MLLLVAGAFLTPGDVVATTLALSGPLYLLFELSILLARVVHRRKRQVDTLLMLLFAPAAFLLARRGRTLSHAHH